MNRPFYPIIYVRGYAMSQSAVEDTVADPYMGFNLGSTKLRQEYTREVVRHIFESPLIRLMKEEQYADIYDHGAEISEDVRPADRSIWIYRYYEPVSKSLGTGDRPEIEDYAKGLGELIDRMEARYCADGNGGMDRGLQRDFRVYLVAHSMGGLICRCFLQKVSPGDRRVDKVFTYATPHGGIDLRGIGNVPDFLRFNNSENFNEKTMRRYLGLSAGAAVNSLDGKFPPERLFSLIGTDHRDYGLARLAVGPMSDGLVQIKNAYAEGSPRAFVHRSHSGHYGIVNSEEGYQNLRRFLFGNVRVDAYLDIAEISLPAAVEKEKDKGKTVHAPYHVEVIGRVRGARWDLHRRTIGEESSVFVDYDAKVKGQQPVQIASIFLANAARVTKARRSLGFSLDLGVQVPEYQVSGSWFDRNHYDGGYLFRDKLNLEATWSAGKGWSLKYGFDRKTPNRGTLEAKAQQIGQGYRFEIPVVQATRPGIQATLRIETSPWNV